MSEKTLRITEAEATDLINDFIAIEKAYYAMCLINDLGCLGMRLEEGDEKGVQTLLEAIDHILKVEKTKLLDAYDRLYEFLWNEKVAEACSPKNPQS